MPVNPLFLPVTKRWLTRIEKGYAGFRGTAGTAAGMAHIEQAIIIKQYDNRRLYSTATASYVSVEELAAMVAGGEDIVVSEAKTGEDITHSVLKRIILERPPHG
jgi:hypothetical protein